MAKPENSKPGCFSGFLRVLLCAGSETSPPVYPSEHADEPETEHQTKDRKPVHAATTPGVVARLMGLDSLPSTKWVVKGATPDLVPRSRSVNFVDYLLEFDPNHVNNHRRAKTSSSFREVPALSQRQQRRDLFVLESDYNASKVQEERHNLRKIEVESREDTWELKQRKKQGKQQGNKQRSKQGSRNMETVVKERVSVKEERNNQGKSKKISKLKNEPRRVPSPKQSSKVRNHNEARDFSHVSSSSKSCSCRFSGDGSSSGSISSSSLLKRNKKGFVQPKVRNNVRNQQLSKKVEAEHSSENLSPVSVLDINDYPFLYGAEFLDGTSTIASSKPKWKSSLLPLFLEDGVEERKNNDKCLAYTDANSEAEYYSELMMKVCTLIEKDIRESDCTLKTENFEAICLEFEHKILDHLLYEVVNEVVELSC